HPRILSCWPRACSSSAAQTAADSSTWRSFRPLVRTSLRIKGKWRPTNRGNVPWRTKSENNNQPLMPPKNCMVSCRDVNGTERSVTVTAESLYDAVAQGLRAFRFDEWTTQAKLTDVVTVKGDEGTANRASCPCARL